MPSRREHVLDGAIVGGCAGLAAAFLRSKSEGRQLDFSETAGHVVTGICMGMAAARFPDMLEPANHPNHRGSFHSSELAIGLAFMTLVTTANHEWTVPALTFGAPAGAGYLMHLVKDAQTPRGLPRLLK